MINITTVLLSLKIYLSDKIVISIFQKDITKYLNQFSAKQMIMLYDMLNKTPLNKHKYTILSMRIDNIEKSLSQSALIEKSFFQKTFYYFGYILLIISVYMAFDIFYYKSTINSWEYALYAYFFIIFTIYNLTIVVTFKNVFLKVLNERLDEEDIKRLLK